MIAAAESPARRRLALVLLALAAAVTIVIAVFDPARSAFYPDCPLHAATGLKCAGCGTLRAMHALTRGQVAEALRQNPLVTALMPLVALALANEARILASRRRWPLPVPLGKAMAAILLLLLVFIVARNWL
jgi:hypothetical protein